MFLPEHWNSLSFIRATPEISHADLTADLLTLTAQGVQKDDIWLIMEPHHNQWLDAKSQLLELGFVIDTNWPLTVTRDGSLAGRLCVSPDLAKVLIVGMRLFPESMKPLIDLVSVLEVGGIMQANDPLDAESAIVKHRAWS